MSSPLCALTNAEAVGMCGDSGSVVQKGMCAGLFETYQECRTGHMCLEGRRSGSLELLGGF